MPSRELLFARLSFKIGMRCFDFRKCNFSVLFMDELLSTPLEFMDWKVVPVLFNAF